MEIVQVINNNLVFSKDARQKEIVVVGRGIGFQRRRGDLVDENKIEKIFVLQNEAERDYLVEMVQNIPYEVISFGISACDHIVACSSRKIDRRYLLIPLVDHIHITLERYQQNVHLDSSALWGIRYLYREEFKIAQDVVDMMISAFNLPIDDSEANYITLHIINAELDLAPEDGYKANAIVETAVRTVEEYLDITLDKDSLDFTRFIVHLQFFAKRIISNSFWEGDEDELGQAIRYRYKTEFLCAKEIVTKLEAQFSFQADEKELFYLTIHIARLLRAGR